MVKNHTGTISDVVDSKKQNEVDLDQALSVAGSHIDLPLVEGDICFDIECLQYSCLIECIGCYNIKYSLVLALFLISCIIEPVGYSYILPAAKCDLQMTNAQRGIIGSIPYIVLAWAILPFNFKIDFGLYDFRPWRLLTLIYSLFFFISAILMSFGPESPKYLISQGKHQDALQVLRIIYAGNKRKSLESYPVKSLKMPDDTRTEKPSFLNSLIIQTRPLLKSPYLKWLTFNGILFFGVFATLNGLYMWLPDVLNRVLTGTGNGGVTACEVIAQKLNETATEAAVCDDSIESITFMINTIANFSCAFIALGVSSTVKLLGKKTLLIFVFIIIGIFCILINFVTQTILFTVLLSSVPLMGLAIGPINAYSVEIFPTNLRGMAVSLTMMVGRIGSIAGTNVAGALINSSCEATFYLFGGLLIVCGLLSFLFPRSNKNLKNQNVKNILTHL